MFARLGFRSLYGVARCRQLMAVTNGPIAGSLRRHSGSGIPPQPFSNMPFNVKSRVAATVFFAFFFGIGLWAPLIIVWYSMAKKAL